AERGGVGGGSRPYLVGRGSGRGERHEGGGTADRSPQDSPAIAHAPVSAAIARNTASACATAAGSMWRWVTRRMLSAVSCEQSTPCCRAASTQARQARAPPARRKTT